MQVTPITKCKSASMRSVLIGILTGALFSGSSFAGGATDEWYSIIEQQKKSQTAFRVKAEALVSEMTLDEKIALFSMSSHEVARLGIPAHDWWNEAIHGVARNGKATQFPVSLAMASTWDPDLVLRMSDAIGKEARGIYNSRDNPTNRYECLTFWSPTLNLARDPLWGRSEETYGEDPLLVSEMATAYIRGLQGGDPNYYQAIACAKHFIANNTEFKKSDSAPQISERDLRECYMPAFRASVGDANVQQVMTAYNAVNGIPCTANRWLITDVLRGEWGFTGTVVTDMGAPSLMKFEHHYVDSHVEGVAALLNAGVDVVSDFDDGYVASTVPSALKQGLVTEEMLDRAVVQNLTTRMQLGQIVDGPDNPYESIPASVVGSRDHLAIAREIAQKGAVLLKNDEVDGRPVLPLRHGTVKKIIVAGPYADVAQLGSYSGMPTHEAVTPLDGIRAAAEGIEVEAYAFFGEQGSKIPSKNLRSPEDMDSGRGLKGSYYQGRHRFGKPEMVRLDSGIAFDWGVMPLDKVDSTLPRPVFSVRWTGKLVPDETGEHRLFTRSEGGMRVRLDNDLIIDQWSNGGRGASTPVQLQAGKEYDLRVDYRGHTWNPSAHLQWIPPRLQEEEFFHPGYAEDSDTTLVVYVAGFSPDMFSEFRRGSSLSLPDAQQRDLERWLERYKRVVVVLNGGNMVVDPWLFDNAPAVLEMWYPGQEGGDALADLVLGKASPSGRLPQTWYRSEADLPAKEDFSIHDGQTYMYNEKPVQFPFGYGLSYTTFEYGPVDYSETKVDANDTLVLKVPVRNTGPVAADEIVQVYARDLKSSVYQPKKKLVGFGRVSVTPGEEKILTVEVPAERLAYWDENQGRFVVEPGKFEFQVGASSEDIRSTRLVKVSGSGLLRRIFGGSK